MTVRCFFCGMALNSNFAWRRIVGWERKGMGSNRRGGSDVALREPRDGFACDPCIEKAKRGLAASQESLV